MRLVMLSAVAPLALVACQKGDLPPESRCTMYWDYYYNSGLGKPAGEREKAEGVDFADIRRIVASDPSAKTRVCQKILNHAAPGDPALKAVTGTIPAAE